MSMATLAQRIKPAPVPSVPSVKTPEGTAKPLANQSGSPGSLGSLKNNKDVPREPPDTPPEGAKGYSVKCTTFNGGLSKSRIGGNWGTALKPYSYWKVALFDGNLLTVGYTPPAVFSEVQAHYPDATIEPIPVPSAAAGSLSPGDEVAVSRWLDAIGETDPDARAQYLGLCASDPRALEWTLAEMAVTQSAPAPAPRHPAPKPKPKPWTPHQWRPATRYGVSPKGHPTVAYEPITEGATP
jgi:hypothetical protein